MKKNFLLTVVVCMFLLTTVSMAAESAIPKKYRYNQADAVWNSGVNTKYNIRDNGCGPTAIATVFSCILGKDITPIDIAKLDGFDSQTYMSVLRAASVSLMKEWYPEEYKKIYGYQNISVYNNPDELRRILKERNDPIIGHLTRHYFTIDCASYDETTDTVGVTGYYVLPGVKVEKYSVLTIDEIMRGEGYGGRKKMENIYLFYYADENGEARTLFDDFSDNHWAYNSVKNMKELGIVTGKAGGRELDPNGVITAQEFIVMFSKVLDEKGTFPEYEGEVYMADSLGDEWSRKAYNKLARKLGATNNKSKLGEEEMRWFLGNKLWDFGGKYDNILKIAYKDEITKDRAANLMGAFLKNEKSSAVDIFGVDNWNILNSEYKPRINMLIENGIINGPKTPMGTLSLELNKQLTRVEAIAMLDRFYRNT